MDPFVVEKQELIVGEGVLNALFGRDSAMEAKHLLPGQVFQSLKNVNSAVGDVPFFVRDGRGSCELLPSDRRISRGV